jgi:hypothetical protein
MRWTSPDPIIPGVGEGGDPNAVGCLGGANYSPLTVGYHENQLLEQLNHENRAGLQDPDFRLPPVPTNSIAFDRYAYSLNNPIRYTDPTGHCPFCLALAAVPVVGWVALGVTAVGVVVYFTVPGVREAVTAGLYDAGEATSNGLNALFAKKHDVKWVDYLQKKYGLSNDEREWLHQQMRQHGLTAEEIEEEAAEIARLKKEKKEKSDSEDE